MPGMVNKTSVEQHCTTLWVYKTTRARIRKAMGRGISVDRFINDLLDMVPPRARTVIGELVELEEVSKNENRETGDNN